MANKKITDLMSGTPVRDSLLESVVDINGTLESRKVKAGAVADLASANVAAPYDSTVTYAIGQYCLYEGGIYRCIAITTGAFDSTAWTQIVVTGEFRRVVELTSAQYSALSSAEKNNGTLYVITDEETTAADIPYSSGVSVADKLDNVPTFDTLTSSDNNKLLGVSVSGSDISVGAVSMPVIPVIRSGIAQFTGLKGGYANRVTVSITFSSPMPNTNYNVFATIADAYADFTDIYCYCFSSSRTVNGCVITVIMNNSLTADHTGYFYWTAIGNQ